MNVLKWLSENGIKKDIYNQVLEIPCADDKKSFIYLTLPFKGIYCWANDVYCREIPTGYDQGFHGMSFNFCMDGGCEVSLFNGNYVYVRAGILSIDTSASKTGHYYPSSRYKGLEIIFDFDEIKNSPLKEFEVLGINPLSFLEKFEERSVCGSFRTIPSEIWQRKASSLVEHLINGDISIEDVRYYLIELLFIFSKDEPNLKACDVGFLSKGQRQLASLLEEKACSDLRGHFTLEEFAKEYKTSTSSVKKYFTRLYGIPAVLFSAQDIKNYDSFYEALESAVSKKTVLDTSALESRYEKIDAYKKIKSIVPENVLPGYSSTWLSAKAVEGDAPVIAKIKAKLDGEKLKAFEQTVSSLEKGVLKTGEAKFNWIDEILEGNFVSNTQTKKLGKFDRLITHRIWGKPVVVLTVLLGLIASFIPALPFMGVGSAIGALSGPITNALSSVNCPPFIIALISDVIINSLSFVLKMLGFVFGVTLVFGLLEEIGVMARISYVFDNTMAKLGLQGKSVMPFLVSFGCTMGGAAGARVIDNWGQKVLTIALAWAVPCGAAWAVPYHKPKWGSLLRYVLGRTKDTFFRVLKIILIIAFIFWLLTFTTSDSIDNSILYKAGKFIEPVTKIFGLGWKTFMAFIVSSLGKEGAIGVLSSIFTDHNMITVGSVAAGVAAPNINELLVANVAKPEALAFIFAITFNMPCIVALASTYQETHSAKWTAIIAIYYTVVALLIACVAYHIGVLIF